LRRPGAARKVARDTTVGLPRGRVFGRAEGSGFRRLAGERRTIQTSRAVCEVDPGIDTTVRSDCRRFRSPDEGERQRRKIKSRCRNTHGDRGRGSAQLSEAEAKPIRPVERRRYSRSTAQPVKGRRGMNRARAKPADHDRWVGTDMAVQPPGARCSPWNALVIT